MSARRLLVFLSVAIVAAAAAGAGSADRDAVRTIRVEPPGLGVSFAVPRGWSGRCDTGTTPRFSIGDPAHVAKLDVFASRSTLTLGAIRPTLVTEVRRRLGARSGVIAASTKLASGRQALRLTFHYRGLWPCGSAAVREIRHAVYFVVHDGILYTFDFGGIEPWASRDAPVFERAARSIRFVEIA